MGLHGDVHDEKVGWRRLCKIVECMASGDEKGTAFEPCPRSLKDDVRCG